MSLCLLSRKMYERNCITFWLTETLTIFINVQASIQGKDTVIVELYHKITKNVYVCPHFDQKKVTSRIVWQSE